MNRILLIDGLVRHTMTLIAKLATMGGVRTSLAHIEQNVFTDLVRELNAQGLSKKIVADMFGMTLRNYHLRMRRLAESHSRPQMTLWQSMWQFIESRQPVEREVVLQRFRHDDSLLVRSVINDLLSSGMIHLEGRANQTVIRTRSVTDIIDSLDADKSARQSNAIASLVWMVIFEHQVAEREVIAEALPMLDTNELQRALLLLEESGRVARKVQNGRETFYAEHFVIPLEDSAGWETALLDHFRAVVSNMTASAQVITEHVPTDKGRGGSTFHFDLDDKHPLLASVFSFLAEVRERATTLRQDIEKINEERGRVSGLPVRVTFYAGQTVVNDTPTLAKQSCEK